MEICLITPAPPGSRKGNRVTAIRWAGILTQLGHRVAIAQAYEGQRCDLLLALHARRSHGAVARFRREHPGAPLIVALTGTDLYGDIHTDAQARESLELASHLILLQPLGAAELPEGVRHKARVIYQSAVRPADPITPLNDAFVVCVMGHLRPVKDPLRTALAARLLPPASRVRVVHLGAALGEDLAAQARAEAARNPRYLWLGEVPQEEALRILAGSQLLSLTSLSEGGANAVTEAIAAGVPILSSRIAGSIGILGADHPGYFPVGDTAALAALLERAEADPGFYDLLKQRSERLLPLVDPERERLTWQSLLDEVLTGSPGRA